jgi:vitamin B12 transporter
MSVHAAPAQLVGPDELLVTASALPHPVAESFRSIAVISRSEIERSPAASLAELLAMTAGVDVQRRGAAGVQADIGIRGASYEQTLVLLNGVPLRDPQTGHHQLNLPVPLSQIERIEIVRGPGGVNHGGFATGGLVNIVTRRLSGPQYGLEVRAGENALRQAGLFLGTGGERSSHTLGVDVRRSDGHLADEPTDFDLRQASYDGRLDFERGSLNWGLGLDDRQFGAYKFYTANFPDQREETQTRLAYVGGQFEAGAWQLLPQVYWREHEDWFQTIVGTRAFINEHETRVQGWGLSARTEAASHATAFGAGGVRERIVSNALGQRNRDEARVWLAHRRELSARAAMELSLNVVDFQSFGRYWLPGVALRHRFTDALTGYASAGRATRQPSYTELYLQTSGNRGRDDLATERSSLYEAGLRWDGAAQSLAVGVFDRRTDQLIDWARLPGSVTWRADQLDGHRTRGLEIDWRWQAPLAWVEELSVSWTTLQTRLDDGGREIKYARDVPRQTLATRLRLAPAANWRLSVDARFAERRDSDAVWLSARLGRQFGRAELFVEGNNLLDRLQPEAGFAPLPGRWLAVGWRYSTL